MEALNGMSEQEREQFFFGVMDGTEEDADTYLESFGVFKKDLPQLIVFSFLDKADEFFYNEGFGKPEEVVGFVRGVANGTYTAQYEGSWYAAVVRDVSVSQKHGSKALPKKARRLPYVRSLRDLLGGMQFISACLGAVQTESIYLGLTVFCPD